MPPVSKETIAETLDSIARLLELKDENPFKVRAYTNAARAIETFPGNLLEMVKAGEIETIPGVGKAIGAKVAEFVETGELPFYQTLLAEFKPGILELFSLPGLGPRKIKLLHDTLGVGSLADLEQACRDGRINGLAGFGKKTAANFLQAIAQRQTQAGTFRLGDVAAEATAIFDHLRLSPDILEVSPAGSYRRRKEIVHDLDFVVSTQAPQEVAAYFLGHPLVRDVLVKGPTKTSVRLRSGIQCDLRVVTAGEFPFALNYFTGSKEHNIGMRNRALQRGWTLNEYRLAPLDQPAAKKRSDPIPVVQQESDLYRALGLDPIEPELRENCGEWEAAQNGSLPDLIELENLRGTFHCHTTESDGRSSLGEMAAAAQDLGLQYLGIADHSKSSMIAHGLDEKRLETQIAQIAALNQEFDGFRLFAGVECDILKDGSLDFSDELLGRLDYVVASVHASFSMPEREMTKRIIRALENPHVTFLGHLTGRMLLIREPYAVDIPAVIEAAAATGTAIELNANPRRLDMAWPWWPLAKSKGVKCVINPDAHHTSALQNLWFGVAIARKGWLTRAEVINCLPLGKIEAELVRKRSAAPPSTPA